MNMNDYGAEPAVLNIECLAEKNRACSPPVMITLHHTTQRYSTAACCL